MIWEMVLEDIGYLESHNMHPHLPKTHPPMPEVGRSSPLQHGLWDYLCLPLPPLQGRGVSLVDSAFPGVFWLRIDV